MPWQHGKWPTFTFVDRHCARLPHSLLHVVCPSRQLCPSNHISLPCGVPPFNNDTVTITNPSVVLIVTPTHSHQAYLLLSNLLQTLSYTTCGHQCGELCGCGCLSHFPTVPSHLNLSMLNVSNASSSMSGRLIGGLSRTRV